MFKHPASFTLRNRAIDGFAENWKPLYLPRVQSGWTRVSQLAGIKRATKHAGAPGEEHTVDRGEASILFGWWSKESG